MAPSMCRVIDPGIRLPSTTLLPSHATNPRARRAPAAGTSGRHWPCSDCPAWQRQGHQNQGGETGKCTQQPVDELHPCVEGVEGGVVVSCIVRPKSCGAIGLKGCSRKVVCGRGPQGVLLQDHSARGIVFVGLPAHLCLRSRRNGESKALGPVGATHSRAGHAHNASGQYHQERRNEGHSSDFSNPEQTAFGGVFSHG